jgi:hypothetical protein
MMHIEGWSPPAVLATFPSWPPTKTPSGVAGP